MEKSSWAHIFFFLFFLDCTCSKSFNMSFFSVYTLIPGTYGNYLIIFSVKIFLSFFFEILQFMLYWIFEFKINKRIHFRWRSHRSLARHVITVSATPRQELIGRSRSPEGRKPLGIFVFSSGPSGPPAERSGKWVSGPGRWWSGFRRQTTEDPPKSDHIHHLPAAPAGAGFWENAIPRCLHARGTCHEAGLKRSKSAGTLIFFCLLLIL